MSMKNSEIHIPQILQSSAWADFQRSLGKTVVEERSSDYSILAVVEPTPIGNYLFLPYGPVLRDEAALTATTPVIRELATRFNAFFVRLEPTLPLGRELLTSLGAKKVKDIDPAETWVVDLPEAQSELLQVFPRRLRGYYNTHEKKGITIKESHNPSDISHLVRLQAKIFAAKHITPYSANYLERELAQDFATLYLAEFEGQVIATVLVFDYQDTRYYMQAASDKSFAKLNAGGILAIQAILDAHEKGLKHFDFWGIAPAGAPLSHPWAGFTQFKTSFKGREVVYSGTYDLPISRLRYALYLLLRKLKGRAK